MDQILEKVMNFINENTMLLIIICIFLIVILVIYLIDNTIKSRKLEQEELEKKENPEPIPTPKIDNSIPEVKTEDAPVIEPVAEEVKEEPKVVVPETPVVEPEVVAPVEEAVEDTAIEINSNIDELLNKDYSENNKLVETIETKPIVEPVTPVVETPKSKYTNDKKLSDIFGKKEEPKVNNIETTQDFSDELDRILKKLNEAENNVDSSLDETGDYTNMF